MRILSLFTLIISIPVRQLLLWNRKVLAAISNTMKMNLSGFEYPQNKIIWAWNDMRVSKWWRNWHFSENYFFKTHTVPPHRHLIKYTVNSHQWHPSQRSWAEGKAPVWSSAPERAPPSEPEPHPAAAGRSRCGWWSCCEGSYCWRWPSLCRKDSARAVTANVNLFWCVQEIQEETHLLLTIMSVGKVKAVINVRNFQAQVLWNLSNFCCFLYLYFVYTGKIHSYQFR